MVDDEYVGEENESLRDKEIGHLGRLAQMCAKYCREFDEIIDSASTANSSQNERQDCDKNFEYLSRGFQSLKRKFKENEIMRTQGLVKRPREPDKGSQPPRNLFTCCWKMGTNGVVCGKVFTSNDDLNDHIKFHTTSELISDLGFYHRTKQQLLQAGYSNLYR